MVEGGWTILVCVQSHCSVSVFNYHRIQSLKHRAISQNIESISNKIEMFICPSVCPSVPSDRTTDRPFVFDCPQWIFNAFSVALFVVVVRYVWQIIMDHKILILLWLFRIIAAWPLDVCHRWTWEYTCMSVCLYIPWHKKCEQPRSQFSFKAIVLIIFIEVLF